MAHIMPVYTGVIFRRGADSAQTFRQQADYLVGTSDWAEFSLAQRTCRPEKAEEYQAMLPPG